MIDVRAEIAKAPVGGYHRLLALAIGLIVFFDGYDTFNPAYVIHYVMKPWHLTPGLAGYIVSSGLLGFAIGALVQGRFADRYGRRSTLVVALWIATVFSLATALFGTSFPAFIVLRIITGIGLGVLLPACVTYISEYAPARFAQTFTLWGWALGWAVGGIVAAAVGIYLTPSLGWQALYYFAALSVVVAIAAPFVLPESLQFLALRGDASIAGVLTRINPANAAAYRAPDARFMLPEPNDAMGSVALLLAPAYRRTTIAIWVAAFFNLFGIFGLTGWAPTVMMQRGEGFVASFAFGALIQVAAFVGSLICGAVVDRRGDARLPMATWWVIGGLALTLLAFTHMHWLNIVCIALAGFGLLGGQNVLNNFAATAYDTEIRSSGVGMMLGVGRFGGILAPVFIGYLQQLAPGGTIVFVAIAAAAILAAVTVMFASPRRDAVSNGRARTAAA